MKCSLKKVFLSHIWDRTHGYHGKQLEAADASLIPHSNRQLECEYLLGKRVWINHWKKHLQSTIYITFDGIWANQPPMGTDNPLLMEQGCPFAKVLKESSYINQILDKFCCLPSNFHCEEFLLVVIWLPKTFTLCFLPGDRLMWSAWKNSFISRFWYSERRNL